jgi:hypothetical protein
MEFKTFVYETTETIRNLIEVGAIVSLKRITKNNNVVLHGITIRADNENISPTIYLNHYYQEYLDGRSIMEIATEIIELYQNHKVKNSIDVNFFTEFDNLKNRIVFKLIHYDKNIKMLNGMPHIKFMDLAIVFYYLVRSDLIGNATILIHNSHMNMWGIDTEVIYRAAKSNTERLLEVEIENIEKVLEEELGADIKELMEEDTEYAIPMYVMSNKQKLNGAACILYQNVLKNFSNKIDSDLYVLPSSVHELIIIPKSGNNIPEELKELVKETNDNHVDDEEILSYSVYEYIRNEDRLQIKI